MKINLKHMAYFAITFLILLGAGGHATAAMLYVDHSGLNYSSIQDAVNASAYSDTIIVKPGTYVENINVNKALTIVSESENPEDTIVMAADPNDHVFDVTASHVTIKGLGIEGATEAWKDGILLHSYVSSSVIEDNKLKDNWGGIQLYTSSNNQVINNTAVNGTHGIYLEDSRYNTLRNNSMYGNLMNFRTDSWSSALYYYNDIDTSNLVEGKPLYYIKDESNLTIDPSYNPGAVYLINCSGVLVKDLSLNSSCSCGLFLYSTNNSFVENLSVSNNYLGIEVYNSNSVNIKNSNISNNSYGIYVYYVTNSSITQNIVSNNERNGIRIDCSNNNTVNDNKFDYNGDYGIWLWSVNGVNSTNFNIIENNSADYNGQYGVYLGGSPVKDNIFINNTANSNGNYGFYFSYSPNNTLIENKANLNAIGIYLYESSNNTLLENNTFDSNSGYGISIYKCNNNTLKNNRVNDTASIGIMLSSSNGNLLNGNIAYRNTYSGIRMDASGHNTLIDNRVGSNNAGIQINYDDSNNNSLVNNVASNNQYGFQVSNSNNNSLVNNIASNNQYGFRAYSSNNNTLSQNNISDNTVYGIYMLNSKDNLIYDNFLKNVNNIQLSGSNYSNSWNTTKTSGTNIIGGIYLGGNFWAKPDGTGFSQTHTDSNGDGICDDIYSITADNIDYLPLSNYTSIPPTLLVADFTATPTSGTAPLIVNFTDQSTGVPTTWAWDFDNDGIVDNANQNVSHTYTSPGTYIVNLTVSNSNGTDSKSVTITVFEQSVSPVTNLNTNESFNSIQEAINDPDTLSEHVISVKRGIYTENVDVNKSVTIVSESGNPEDTIIRAVDPDDYVFDITSSHVTIEGFTIEGATGTTGYLRAGINLWNYEDECKIKNNVLKNNIYGIHTYNSRFCLLENNTVTNNTEAGIFLETNSEGTVLRNNTMYGNKINFRIEGESYLRNYKIDADTSNLVEGKPLIYIKDESGFAIDPTYNPGAVYLINCSNVMVKDLKLNSSCDYGLFLYNTNNSVVEHLNVSNNNLGIGVRRSSNVRINNSSVSGTGAGIFLSYSTNNTLSNNTAANNSQGFKLDCSSNNTILDNNANMNSIYGICILSSSGVLSSGNIVKRNFVNSTNGFGICLSYNCANNVIDTNKVNFNNYGMYIYSDNNTLCNNFVGFNNYAGLYLHQGKNNSIFNNSFNNSKNVDQYLSTNTWNITKTPGANIVGGPYLGGNFWAKPDGTGFSQTHTDNDGDGICDEIYTIATGNTDYLPLANYTSLPTIPVASFTATPTSGTAPLIVNFTDQSTGVPTTWAWDFDNDSIVDSMGQNASHTYTSAGIYTVNLTVSNENGTDSKVATITVLEQSISPITNLNTSESFSSIQEAINDPDTLNGNVISVKSGIYTENVDVNKSVTIVSESGNPEDTIVRAANPNDHVFDVTRSQVKIKGFGIEGSKGGWKAGILLHGYVSSSVIEGNKLKDNWGGIQLYTSSNNQVINNTVANGTHGIYLEDSRYNTLRNNSMYGNLMNFRTDSWSSGLYYYNDIDTSNLVEGKPLYYIKDESGLTIDPGYNPGAVYLINCSNVLVRDLKLNSSCSYGLFLFSTNNSLIVNLAVSNNYAGGIGIRGSSNVTINNSIVSETGTGISLSYSTNNTLSNNIAMDNSYGLYLDCSSNNTLFGNVADLNNYYGICLWSSGGDPSSWNVVKQNQVRSNNNYGINVGSNCNNNSIFNNYFNNTVNVYWHSSTNTWNITKTPGKNIVGGPYIGGNFWAKPDGTGFSQTHSDTDRDGICDEIYNISAENIDYLPLSNYTSTSPILPAANFTATPASGTAPLMVNFTDQSTGEPTGWAWEFGDGITDTIQNVSHNYTSPGIYTVNLTVSNENGTNTTSAAITVSENSPVLPVANFGSNITEGYAPLSVQFTDLSENANEWDWDFGDGNSSTEQNPVHTYYAAGNYTVELIASNVQGSDQKTSTVRVLSNIGQYAYITNYYENTVSVIDITTNEITEEVTVGNNPFGVAVNPEGTRVYASNLGSNTISVIDTATNTVIENVNVGKRPYGVAVSPDGTKVYVANEGGNVSMIDAATNTVTATINSGKYPSGVVVSPDGTKVYVVNEEGTISIIDTATNTVTATVPVGNNPIGVAVSPDGTKVYVTNYDSDTVSVIDSSTNTVAATVPVGSRPGGVAVGPDGIKVYVTNEFSNTVSVIDTAVNIVEETVDVGTSPWGVAVNPDGTKVYVINEEGTVSVIDTNTNQVTATINLEKGLIAFGKFLSSVPTPMPICNSSTVYGYSFNDSNINQEISTGEDGLSNIKISLNGYDTCKGKLISKTTITNSTGYFEFKNVGPGVYVISENFIIGWLPTTDAAYTLTIPSNSTSIRKDFGNRIFVR